MTKDDIIRMAREVQIIEPSDPDDGAVVAEKVDILTRFHNLAVIAERQAIATEFDRRHEAFKHRNNYWLHAANYVRARSQS